MFPISSIAQYKELLQENRQRGSKLCTNCFSMSDYFIPFIEEKRLFGEMFPSGLVICTDELQYYNLYYHTDPSAPFPEISLPKPVLIEEINNRGSRDGYIREMEKKFKASGFDFFKINRLYEMSLSPIDPIKNRLESHLAVLDAQGLSLRIADTDDMERQSVSLWESALDATDLPESHKHFIHSDTDTVLCLTAREKVIGTYWLGMRRSFAEGRHIVIHPDYMRRGLGTLLLLSGACRTAEAGKEKVITWISDTNLPSIAMHTAVGFKVLDRGSIQYIKK